MRNNKATHEGTCQVCGRLQKLPAGVLAKHGYTTAWGFFSGTCWGSGYRPFEQATDAIEKAITWATEQKISLERAVQRLEAAPVTATAPFHRYKTAKTRYERSGYTWEDCTLNVGASGRIETIEFADGTKESAFRYALHLPLEDAVALQREKRIEDFRRDIAERDRYIAWQQSRIATWKPGDLKKVA